MRDPAPPLGTSQFTRDPDPPLRTSQFTRGPGPPLGTSQVHEGPRPTPRHFTVHEGPRPAARHFTVHEGLWTAPRHFTVHKGLWTAPRHFTVHEDPGPPLGTSQFTTAFNLKVAETSKMIGTLATKFSLWVEEMTGRDDTWQFWSQFVFVDGMAYVGQFLAMRSGNWHLRQASIKLMAPVFTAFDHQIYQKVISQHLADILCMPPSILTMFQQGAFVVSVEEHGTQ